MKKLISLLLLAFLSLNCLSFKTYDFVIKERTLTEILAIEYSPDTKMYHYTIVFENAASGEIIVSEHVIGELNFEFEQMLLSGKYRVFVTTTTNFLTDMVIIYPEWIPWITSNGVEIDTKEGNNETDI